MSGHVCLSKCYCDFRALGRLENTLKNNMLLLAHITSYTVYVFSQRRTYAWEVFIYLFLLWGFTCMVFTASVQTCNILFL